MRVRKPAVKSVGLFTVCKAQMPVFARLDPVILVTENTLQTLQESSMFLYIFLPVITKIAGPGELKWAVLSSIYLLKYPQSLGKA